jgi:hypothetical protein
MVVTALVDTAPGLVRRGRSPAVATPVWATASAVIRAAATRPTAKPAWAAWAAWAAIPVIATRTAAWAALAAPWPLLRAPTGAAVTIAGSLLRAAAWSLLRAATGAALAAAGTALAPGALATLKTAGLGTGLGGRGACADGEPGNTYRDRYR